MSDLDYSRPETIIKNFNFQEINLGKVGSCVIKIANFPDIDINQTAVFMPRFVEVGNGNTDTVSKKITNFGGKIEEVELTSPQKEMLQHCFDSGLSILESVHVTFNKPHLIKSIIQSTDPRVLISVIGEPGSGKSMLLAALALKFDDKVFGGMDPFSRFPVELYLKKFEQLGLNKDSTPQSIYETVRKVGQETTDTELPKKPASLSQTLDDLLELKKGHDGPIFIEGLSTPFNRNLPVISHHLASIQGTEATINLHTGGQMMEGKWAMPLGRLQHGYVAENDMWKDRPRTDLYWTPENTTSGKSLIGMNEKVLEYFLEDQKLSRKVDLIRIQAFRRRIVELLN